MTNMLCASLGVCTHSF